MGEKKGYLFTLVFFIGIIVPAIFMFGVDALNQSAFTKTTAEVGEMVKEEGGVTAKVADTVNELQRKGYEIRFTNNGSNVTSAVPYGTTIVAHYKYKYHAGFFPRELNVSNKLEILKRDSVGSGNIEQGGVIKTITVNSDEIEKADHVQTWNIPYLKSIRNITSNSGSAHVVNQQGENVTISMNNGSPSRQELIENGEIEDRKYVEGIDHEYYEDAEGYKGILEKYLVRGSLIEEKTKYIEKHNEENYVDAEGYTGKLDRYFVGGNLHPEHTKEVSEKLTSDVDKSAQQKNVTQLVTSNEDSFADSILYNKDGYKGTINKKGNSVQRLISGEYIPEHKKYVDGQTSENYNKDGYVGKLEKYVVSGEYLPADTKEIKDYDAQINVVANDVIGFIHNLNGSILYNPIHQNDFVFHTPVRPWIQHWYDKDSYVGYLYYYENGVRMAAVEYLYKYYKNQILNEIILHLRSKNIYTNKDLIDAIKLNNGNSLVFKDSNFKYLKQITYTSYGSGNYAFGDYAFDIDLKSMIDIFPGLKLKFNGTVTRPAKDTRVYAYRGYVTKPEVDTRVYEYDQLYEGTVNQDTDILFPETIEYDKDGYKGTLAKDGEVTEILKSGEYIPYDEKFVENEDSAEYDVDGYKGTLEKYVAKGEFIPEESKEGKLSLESLVESKLVSDEVESNNKDHVFADSIPYNQDGFKGTLIKKGEPKKVLVSGEYIPADSKYLENYEAKIGETPVSPTIGYNPFLYRPNDLLKLNIKANLGGLGTSMTYDYLDSEGYKGTLLHLDQYGNKVMSLNYLLSLPQLFFDELEIEVLDFLNSYNIYTNDDFERYAENNNVNIYDTHDMDKLNDKEYKYIDSEIGLQKYDGRFDGGNIEDYDQGYFIHIELKNLELIIPDTILKYSGIVTRPEKDTRVFKYVQEYEGIVEKLETDFPETVEYSEEGFTGTLVKDGEPRKIADDEKNVAEIVEGTTWEWFISDLEIPSRIQAYSKDGYVGLLNAKNPTSYKTTSSRNFDRYQTVLLGFNSNDKTDLEKDIKFIEGFGDQAADEDGIDYVIRRTLELYPNYSNIEVEVDTIEWDGEVLEGTFGKDDFYKFQRNVKLNFYADLFKTEQLYEGTVVLGSKYVQDYKGAVIKPESDTREYKYRGTVRRHESDTRKYEYVQSYKGDVTKPESDTREYAYHGNVSKPAEDTREYKYRGEVVKRATSNTGETKPYYQYEITIEYEAWQ